MLCKKVPLKGFDDIHRQTASLVMATANTKGKKKGRKAKRAYKKAVPPPPPPPPIPTGKEGKEKFTFFFRKESPFSQWHPVEFRVDGVEFNCAEQFMMYQKASKYIYTNNNNNSYNIMLPMIISFHWCMYNYYGMLSLL